MAAPLSRRGRKLVDQPLMGEYLLEHFARRDDSYNPISNPDGYIALCLAENKLVWDLLRPKMLESRDIPQSAICYDDMIGSAQFRAQVATFMGRTFMGRTVDPEHVIVLAGGGSILECLFYVIGDTGDGVLVPTPSYSGFWPDLEGRDGLKIVPVDCRSDSGFRLTTEMLDAALAGADRPIKALLFTTPNNPLGTVYSAAELEAVLTWCETNGIHAVIDEIYALSVFGQSSFVSAAELRPILGDLVHIIWAFSKDFGASGLRCGVLVTENPEIFKAVEAQAYWAVTSGDTQFMLGELISDEAWVDGYIKEMQSGLGEAYARVTDELTTAGISFIPGEAGFFFLCDMREYMAEPSWEAEEDLWRHILEEANVNITPGWAGHNAEPGFLRLCFASDPTDTVVAGVRRMAAVLENLR